MPIFARCKNAYKLKLPGSMAGKDGDRELGRNGESWPTRISIKNSRKRAVF
jgi:hypothetical protein